MERNPRVTSQGVDLGDKQLASTVSVNEIIDRARFGRTHWLIIALTGLLLIVDGYDVFVYGAILPALMEDWSSPLRTGSMPSAFAFSSGPSIQRSAPRERSFQSSPAPS